MNTQKRSLPFTTLATDLRGAARRLFRSPGWAIFAVVTLGLALGVCTTIFSVVHTVLIRPLPYVDAARLVNLSHRTPGAEQAEVGMSSATYFHYRDLSQSFVEMGLYQEAMVNVTGDGPPERLPLAMVTHTVFPTLGITPAHGRFFADRDDLPGAPSMVVLSHDLWMHRFGGDESVIGSTIAINGRSREIVGVAPRGLHFPSPETRLWMPMRLDPAEASIGELYLGGVGRLAAGQTPAGAEANLASLVPSLSEAYGDLAASDLEQMGLRPRVEPLRNSMVAEVARPLWILFAVAGLVLLITCANLANLLLVRAEHRIQELAVRTALGAGRGDLIRFFLCESALLTLLASGLGLLLTGAAIRVVATLNPGEMPRFHELEVNGTTVVFILGAGLLAALLVSGLPIVRYARQHLGTSFNSCGRGISASRVRGRTRNLLMISQVAMTALLLIGAGLFWRSSWYLDHTDLGFRSNGVLTVQLVLPYRAYPRFDDAATYFQRLIEALRALPGVSAVGAVSNLPLGGIPSELEIPLDRDLPRGATKSPPLVTAKFVTPGYFETLEIPWVAGRAPQVGDRVGTIRPVVVNEALAHLLFPAGNAVGQRIRRAVDDNEGAVGTDTSQWNTIVGVVGDVRETSVSLEPPPILYLPVLDQAVDPYFVPRGMNLAIRTDLAPASLTPAVRRLAWAQDADLPVTHARTLSEIVRRSTARTRVATQLLSAASVVALVLGALGIYSVLSYAVSRRRHEIGVRIALGAQVGDVRRAVLFEGGTLVLVGLGIGAIVAMVLTRYLHDLLYQVSPTDPLTFGMTLCLLFGVALLAIYVPAHRASRVDPIQTLNAG